MPMISTFASIISDCRSVVHPLLKLCIQPVAIVRQYPITFTAVVDITTSQKRFMLERLFLSRLPLLLLPIFCIYRFNIVVAFQPSLNVKFIMLWFFSPRIWQCGCRINLWDPMKTIKNNTFPHCLYAILITFWSRWWKSGSQYLRGGDKLQHVVTDMIICGLYICTFTHYIYAGCTCNIITCFGRCTDAFWACVTTRVIGRGTDVGTDCREPHHMLGIRL